MVTWSCKMTIENLEKQYAHLTNLVAGNHKSGNPVRDELIKSDAVRTMAILLKKFPSLEDESTPEDTDFSSKTKAELTEIAEGKDLDISEAKTKDDLIVILEASEEA